MTAPDTRFTGRFPADAGACPRDTRFTSRFLTPPDTRFTSRFPADPEA
ncbi:hypothetical protein [Nannocystis sp. SCPEA4]|nr:hypothetical protein [Nannocystis sp. SCPEA4]MCY1056698.1 hypothetical protein [Nannocystis sp. SCPEA4]